MASQYLHVLYLPEWCWNEQIILGFCIDYGIMRCEHKEMKNTVYC